MQSNEKLNYAVISGKNYLYSNEIDLRNKAFEAWHKVWSKVYQDRGSDFKLSSDEFSRQDLVCILQQEEQIVAMHLYSFFNLHSNPDKKSHYFDFFSENYLQALAQKNVKSVMSMEFLTVVPEFRKRNFGFPTGSLICELGTRMFGLTQADAIVAPARIDVKVHEIAYDIGFDCIEKGVMQRGFECDMIACFQGKQKRSDIPLVSSTADEIWNSKKIMKSAELFLSQKKPVPVKTKIAA